MVFIFSNNRRNHSFVLRLFVLLVAVIVVFTLFVSVSSFGAEKDVKKFVESLQEKIAQTGVEWKAGLTDVAMLSQEEKKKLLGEELRPVPPDERMSLEGLEPVTLPESFDWRNASHNGVTGNWMTSVKDQGRCGSCWDFAAVGVVEMLNDLSSGDPAYNQWEDLSEQKILSCCDYCGSCNGGWSKSAFEYMRNSGIVREECMHYQASDTVPCEAGCGETPQKIGPSTYINSNVETIKRAIKNYGAVKASFTVYEDFYFYSGGVYEHVLGDHMGGHAIVLAGWGRTQSGEGYWIAKNSWGTGWGNDGWFKIKWGACEINRRVVMATLDDSFASTDVTVTVKGPGGNPVNNAKIFVNGNERGETNSSGVLTTSMISDLNHEIIALKSNESSNSPYGLLLRQFEVPAGSTHSLELSGTNASRVEVTASNVDGSPISAGLNIQFESGLYKPVWTGSSTATLYITPSVYDLQLWNYTDHDEADELYNLRKLKVDLTKDNSVSFDIAEMETIEFVLSEFSNFDELEFYVWRASEGLYWAPGWLLEEGDRGFISAGKLDMQTALKENTSNYSWWVYLLRSLSGIRKFEPGQLNIKAGGYPELFTLSTKETYRPGEEAWIKAGFVDSYDNDIVEVVNYYESNSTSSEVKLYRSNPDPDKLGIPYNDKGSRVSIQRDEYYPSLEVKSPSSNSTLRRQSNFWHYQGFDVTGAEKGTYEFRAQLYTHFGTFESLNSFSVGVPAQIATYNNGNWWVDINRNDAWDGPGTDLKIDNFGSAGDQAAIGDLDSDGKDELALFHAGTWKVDKNNNYVWDEEPKDMKIDGFGSAGNKVAIGDFDGDARDEIATFNAGTWWIDLNNNDQWDGPSVDKKVEGFGNANNQVAAGDFDGNGTDEIATFTAGTWWMDLNNNDQWDGEPTDKKVEGFGNAGNIVAAGNLSAPSSTAGSLNLEAPSTPKLDAVSTYPNPVTDADRVTFRVEGEGIESMRVAVFTASGKKVYSSRYTEGKSRTWDLTTAKGSPVTNGIYIYQVSGRDEYGRVVSSQFRKLLVLK